LIGQTIRPIPAEQVPPERVDGEYVRNGVATLFMIFVPLLAWRSVRATQRWTGKDFAEVLC
jgi:hypothetical protein